MSPRDATTRRRRRKARSSSGSDVVSSSEEDRGSSPEPTRFLKLNKDYAVTAIAACGCAQCKVYKHLKKHRGKDIVRAARKLIGTFREPNPKARIADLREWAAMLFWCGHRPADQQWKDLSRAEQQYIIKCLVTPTSWSSGVREAFGRSSTEVVWRETRAGARKRIKALRNSTPSPTTAPALPSAPESPTRAAQGKAARFAKINSLRFNAAEWLNAEELKDVQKAARLQKLAIGAGSTTSAQPPYRLPYAEDPHAQSLVWPLQKPVNTEQAGRMVNVAMRVSSSAFNDPVEKIAHNAREEADKKLFAEFDSARRDRDTGGILLAVEKAKSHATEVLEGAVATAVIWEKEFPCMELREIVAGRRRQLGELNAFFAAISKGVSIGADAQRGKAANTYIVGAWSGFFDGLRAGRYSSSLTASTLRRGRQRLSPDKERSSSGDDSPGASSDDDDDDDSDSRRGRRKRAKERRKKSSKARARQDGADGGSASRHGKAGGGAATTSTVRCRKGVHFPCSKSILGPKLGVQCSAVGQCRFCKKTGHWAGECPIEWASAGQPFPGYSPNGKRYREDWDVNKNPKQECIKAWVKFLKSKKRFPNGGIAALEPRAPALSDFEAWVGQAQ